MLMKEQLMEHDDELLKVFVALLRAGDNEGFQLLVYDGTYDEIIESVMSTYVRIHFKLTLDADTVTQLVDHLYARFQLEIEQYEP